MRTDYACASRKHLEFMDDLKAEEYWVYPKSRQDLSLLKPLAIPLRIGLCCDKWNEVFREQTEAGFNKSPHFTTGFAAIVMALEWLRPEQLYLAGFDNLLEPKSLYRNVLKNWMGTTPHDLVTENRMLALLETHYHCALLPF